MVDVVKAVRRALPAIALAIATIGTVTIPAFAAAAHPVCVAKQHDCGKTPSIRPCCCGEESNGSDQSGPVPGKASVGVSLVPIAAIFSDSR